MGISRVAKEIYICYFKYMSRKNTILSIIKLLASTVANFEILTNFVSKLEDLNQKHFDINQPIPGRDSSLANMFSRVSAVQGVIETFDKSREYNMIPLQRLVNLQNSIQQLNDATTQIQTNFTNILNQHGGYSDFNYDNFHVQTKDGSSPDLMPYFVRLDNAVEALLEAFYSSVIILKPVKAQISFQGAANSLQNLVSEVLEQLNSIRGDGVQLKSKLKDAEVSWARISSLEEKVGSSTDKSDDLVQKMQQVSDTCNQHMETISSIKDDAAKLENTVQNYQAQFSKFQNDLDSREKDFKQGSKSLADLILEFENKKNEITDNIERSEAMLTGATVAGLASNFKTIEDKLTLELSSAKNSFYFGAVCLFVSALPLVFSVFMPVIAPFFINDYPNIVEVIKETGINSNSTGWQYVGQVMARLVIIMPAVWFMSFAAIRYSSLFRLREHYSYKYSMAVSVEGFKKEAQGYESEIAAMVLEQLAFNPADKLQPSKDMNEGKVPNPLMQFLMKKIRSKVNEASPNNTE